MIRLFRNTFPTQYLLLLVLVVLAHVSSFWSMEPSAISLDRQVSLYLTGYWYELKLPYPWVQVVIAGLCYLEALVFNAFVARRGILSQSSLVPALLFVLISALCGLWLVDANILIGTGCMLAGLYSVYRFSEDNLSRQHIFYAGFSVGFAVLFYLPAIAFIPALLVLLILEQGSLRNFLLAIVGILLPIGFVAAGFYLVDWLSITPKAALRPGPFSLPNMEWTYYLLAVYLVLLSILGGIRHGQQRSLQTTTSKQTADAFALFLLVVVLGFLTSAQGPMYYLGILILPVSLFASIYFDKEKISRVQRILFWVLVLMVVYYQAAYFFYPDLLSPTFGPLPAPNV